MTDSNSPSHQPNVRSADATSPSGTKSEKRRKRPYYQMFPETLKSDYQKGYITATGYLYYYLKSRGKDGWRFRIPNISKFCKELGIGRTAFYKAKADLISKGILSEQILGSLDIWINPGSSLDPKSVTFANNCHEREHSVTDANTSSAIANTLSAIANKHPPESQVQQASCNSSDLSQPLSQPLSHPASPIPERELLSFVIRSIQNQDGIRNPRAYALKVLKSDRQHWEEAFRQWQIQTAQISIPPPSSPEQKNGLTPSPEEQRQSLIGLIHLKRQQGQPLSKEIKQRATELGINLHDPQETST